MMDRAYSAGVQAVITGIVNSSGLIWTKQIAPDAPHGLHELVRSPSGHRRLQLHRTQTIMKTICKMVGAVLLALFANMSWTEGSLVPGLKHMLHTRQMKAAKSNGADATGSLARFLKNTRSSMRSAGLSLQGRPDALRQVVARQLDMHSPACNRTMYSDNVCGNMREKSMIPIQCTQLVGSEFSSTEIGIVDDELFFFSFMQTNCTGLGVGMGFGKDWENRCIYYPSDDVETYAVSCEEEPPTFASRSPGTCDIRQYANSQCSGSSETVTVPSGCTKIEEDGQTLYLQTQEIKGMLALMAYEEEGCTGASAAVMLGEAEGLSKCAPFGNEGVYIQVQCEEPDSAASSLLVSSALYFLAFGIAWLFSCVV